MRRLLFAGLAAIAAATLAACSGSTPEAAPASTARVGGPLSLIVVSDGSHNSMLLEWAGGPANATKWQYRLRRWENAQPLAWTDWTDVRGGGANTRSYRLKGLQADTGYEFEVRPVVGTVAGVASLGGLRYHRDRGYPARASTHERNIPRVFPYQIVEGDGRTQWRIGYLSFTITIPDGVRLVGGGAFISDPCPTPTAAPPGVEATPIPGCSGSGGRGTWIEDFASGSILTIGYQGDEWNRRVVEPTEGSSEQRQRAGQSINDLFDQIMDSVRKVD